MAAFIPSRRDPEVNEIALARVREDKQRESGDGFDGTWVAHPDLVPTRWRSSTRRSASGRTSSSGCARTSRSRRPTCSTSPATPGEVTEAGVRANVSVGIRYIAAWLSGVGAAAIDNLMEDAATAEISRSQVWQWVHHGRVARADVERTIAEVSRPSFPTSRSTRRARACSSSSRSRRSSPSSSRSPAYERLLER